MRVGDPHEQDKFVDRGTQEHVDKYHDLASLLGIEAVARLVPVSTFTVQRAILKGDQSLNSISLSKWDYYDPKHRYSTYDQDQYRTRTHPVWQLRRATMKSRGEKTFSMSLSECVCVLKHVARHLAVIDAWDRPETVTALETSIAIERLENPKLSEEFKRRFS
jgi:hypothetical protein